MTDAGRRWSDRRIETMVAQLLRGGLLLAAVVVLAGAAVYLYRHGTEMPSYTVFRGEPATLEEIGGIAGQALGGRSGGLMQLGLVLLLATPVARVALSALAFALQHDWLYVGVTLGVLAVLLYSILGAYL